ncbi:glucose-6-phosphatase 3 isoform X1 [Pseudonaja textilis]|nr:glucose-6-phosphatase 3 isoform X1 [Pseudonaja textilis]
MNNKGFTTMDIFYTSGVQFAEMLQSALPGLEDFWLWVTFFGDPKCVFIIYFPLAYFLLDKKIGLTVLWLGLISEWLNLMSKWLLFGERPFWWISESGFSKKKEIFLRQFPSSCETGPGSPSGHCMITGAALWPIVSILARQIAQNSKSWIMRAVPFTVYFLLLLFIGLSRIFILAHFPHQVIGGILAGISLGWLLQSWIPLERGFRFYLMTSFSLGLSATVIYWTLIILGIDLNWSMKLAAKWCENPKWIRMDTYPFASLCRDTATVLGLGLAFHSSSYTELKLEKLGWLQRGWCAVLSLVTLYFLSSIAQPQGVALWYGLNFVKYASFPWIVISLLPKAVQKLASPGTPSHPE